MKKIFSIVLWTLLLVLAVVFLSAGIPKILNPGSFARNIYNYHLVPGNLINGMALFLPWLEILCAVALLLIPKLRPAALILIVCMLLIFIYAQSMAMYKGIDIACGCFSTSGGKKVGWHGIAQNIALTISALFCIFRTPKCLLPFCRSI